MEPPEVAGGEAPIVFAADEFEAISAAHPDDGPSRFYLKTCRSRRRTASTPVG